MIQWCAFCQRFMGETKPFDDFSITHGICRRCLSRGAIDDERAVALIRPIADLQRDLKAAGRAGDLMAAESIFARGITLGVRPVDLLIGVVQPALEEIGALWEQGKVTVADEHRFTALSHELVELAFAAVDPELRRRSTQDPEVLLVCADGNYHDLGPNVVELYLLSRGVPTLGVYPGLPSEDVDQLCTIYRPRLLGISAALETQYQAVEGLLRLPLKCRLILGGSALKRSRPDFGSGKIELCDNLRQLDRIIEEL